MPQVKIIWFNFQDLGLPGWYPVPVEAAEIMLLAAESVIETYTPDELEQILEIQHHDLTAVAAVNQITDVWIDQALLYRALCGLLGYAIPDVRIFP